MRAFRRGALAALLVAGCSGASDPPPQSSCGTGPAEPIEDATPSPIVSGQGHPSAVAATDRLVFFADEGAQGASGSGGVWRYDEDTKNLRRIATGDRVIGLAVDANDVYWSDAGSSGPGGVYAGSIASGTIDQPRKLADRAYERFLVANGTLFAAADGAVVAISVDFPDTPSTMAQLSPGERVTSLAIDQDHLYFAVAGEGGTRIDRTGLGGGLLETVVEAPAGGDGLAIAGSTLVYAADAKDGCGDAELDTVSPGGGETRLLAPAQRKPIVGPISDGRAFYWVTTAADGTQSLHAALADGSTRGRLATGLVGVTGLAIDEAGIWIASGLSGSVSRVSP
jgi:hypothetical protein